MALRKWIGVGELRVPVLCEWVAEDTSITGD